MFHSIHLLLFLLAEDRGLAEARNKEDPSLERSSESVATLNFRMSAIWRNLKYRGCVPVPRKHWEDFLWFITYMSGPLEC